MKIGIIRITHMIAHVEDIKAKPETVALTTMDSLAFEKAANRISNEKKAATGLDADITAIVIAVVIIIGVIVFLILCIILAKILKKKDPIVTPASSVPSAEVVTVAIAVSTVERVVVVAY